MALFFLLSVGRKWMVGMRQTSCMGSASTKQELFRSQPAPSRYRPRTQTPSWEDMGAGYGKSKPLIASTLDLPPLSSLLNQLFPTLASSTLLHHSRLWTEPQAHLAPTLGGYTRLLSSTVETINSQERQSTEIWD